VYKARKRLGIEFVALRKVDKSRQPKLLNEVRALGELRHGNVLAFHGWYYTERHLWVVSEYCAGGDLASLLAHDGQLPEPTVVSLGLDALAALQHVHSRGFLAVDLTPNAFLLNESGAPHYSLPGCSCTCTPPPLFAPLSRLPMGALPSDLK
jgi:serine/threonine-protein kinase ULK4